MTHEILPLLRQAVEAVLTQFAAEGVLAVFISLADNGKDCQASVCKPRWMDNEGASLVLAAAAKDLATKPEPRS